MSSIVTETNDPIQPGGQIQDSPGFAVLPDRRVILPGEAAGVPLVRTVEVDPGLRIEGEAGAQTATITCPTALGAWQAVGSQDVDLTEDFTARLRARAVGA